MQRTAGTGFSMTYTLKVEQHEKTGECFILLPEDLLEQVDWQEGDNIEWIDNKDGSFTLKKNEK
jgi:nitrous oxide reductase accessory protein NosL